MVRTKDLKADYNHIRESYLQDMDISGGMYLELIDKSPKITLDVTQTNFGYFYQAKLNGRGISETVLMDILNIKSYKGMTLEHYLLEFEKKNPKYKIIFWEKDVS